MKQMGERTVWIDCDVIQADGGTRTASITGAYIALADAFAALKEKKLITQNPLLDYLAAISVGKVNGQVRLDLSYEEDSQAEVDMNLVMTGNGRLVEVQGTAEQSPFSKKDLDDFLAVGWSGIQSLIKLEKELVGGLA
jgi:ribonuclease PH